MIGILSPIDFSVKELARRAGALWPQIGGGAALTFLAGALPRRQGRLRAAAGEYVYAPSTAPAPYTLDRGELPFTVLRAIIGVRVGATATPGEIG